MLLSAECSVALLCPTLCIPMDCSPPGSSVHGISQARVLEWLAISFSRLMLVISPTNASSLVVSVCSSWGEASLRLTVAEQGLGPSLSSGRAPSAGLPQLCALSELRSKGETSSRQLHLLLPGVTISLPFPSVSCVKKQDCPTNMCPQHARVCESPSRSV